MLNEKRSLLYPEKQIVTCLCATAMIKINDIQYI